MDFQEADRQYVEIKRRHEAGELAQEEFDDQVKQLMVQDEEGRWWAKSRTTGDWHYHDGTAWVKGTPPGYQVPQAAPEDQPETQQSESVEAQEPGRRVAALYAEGQQYMDAEEWHQALECFEEAQRLEPGYRDTDALLSRARQELESPQMVEVPDLSGQEVPQANSALASKELNLGPQKEARSDTVPEGRVIEQNPEPGVTVTPGSSVSVTVSSGPSTVEVPDLAGKSHSQVRNLLRAAGLELGTVAETHSDDMPEGRIIEQSLVAGRKVERGSTVHITVSSRPQEAAIRDRSEQSGARTAQTRSSPAGDRGDVERKIDPIAKVFIITFISAAILMILIMILRLL